MLLFSGAIVCDACSRQRFLIAHVDPRYPVRVCTDCAVEFNTPSPNETTVSGAGGGIRNSAVVSSGYSKGRRKSSVQREHQQHLKLQALELEGDKACEDEADDEGRRSILRLDDCRLEINEAMAMNEDEDEEHEGSDTSEESDFGFDEASESLPLIPLHEPEVNVTCMGASEVDQNSVPLHPPPPKPLRLTSESTVCNIDSEPAGLRPPPPSIPHDVCPNPPLSFSFINTLFTSSMTGEAEAVTNVNSRPLIPSNKAPPPKPPRTPSLVTSTNCTPLPHKIQWNELDSVQSDK